MSRDTTERPRQDSNLRTRLRRPMLYPLSYEGEGRTLDRSPGGVSGFGGGGRGLGASKTAAAGAAAARQRGDDDTASVKTGGSQQR